MNLFIVLAAISSALLSVTAQGANSIVGRITATGFSSTLPDANVSVFAIKPGDGGSMRVELVAKTKTTQDGQYSFTGLNPASYMVRAELLGFVTEQVWDVWFSEGRAVVDIGLTNGTRADPYSAPRISGTVRGPGNVPVNDATVTLVRCDNSARRFQTRTDKNGSYDFRQLWLQEGEYSIQVSRPDFRSATKLLRLEKSVGLDFRLRSLE